MLHLNSGVWCALYVEDTLTYSQVGSVMWQSPWAPKAVLSCSALYRRRADCLGSAAALEVPSEVPELVSKFPVLRLQAAR